MAEKDPRKREPKLKGYSKEELIQTFRHFQTHRKDKESMWKRIHKFHSGQFWRDLKKKLPKHQIMPDTNFIEYIEKNITNSVYAGSYMAQATPNHYDDNKKVDLLNKFLRNKIMEQTGLKEMFPQLGSDTVLYNLAAIQVGWDSDSISGTSHRRERGKVDLSYIPPRQLYLDPSVTDYQQGRAIFRARKVSLFDLLNEENLKDGAKDYMKILSDNDKNFHPVTVPDLDSGEIHKDTSTTNEYSREVSLLEAFYKVEESNGNYRIDHVFIADHNFVLSKKENIQPKKFPIKVLYGETPKDGPYGTPMIYKIIPNVVTYNMLHSLEATHIYNTQNRAKFLNVKSGIDYRKLAKYGNTPHVAFPVKGNPDDVVKYNDVQALPDITNTKMQLREDIFLVTGVDLRYTGRDTGSIQTTGGTDLAQQRTMTMTDSLRIINLEHFVENLTRLIIDFYIQFGHKYKVNTLDEGTNEAQKEDNTLDFTDIEDNDFSYSLNATPHLPRNRTRLADAADQLMELQGQYQFDPPIITPEEWLSYKDFPQKDLQLQRMRSNQRRNDQQEIETILKNFVGLLDEGLTPDEAIQIMVEEKEQMRKDPKLGQGTEPMQ